LLFLGAAAANSDQLETSLTFAPDMIGLLASLGKAWSLFGVADQPVQKYLQAVGEVSMQLKEVLKSCVDEKGHGLLDLLLEEEPAEAATESKNLLEAMYRKSPAKLWEMVAHDVWAIKKAAQNAQAAPACDIAA
jgi:hypothetical protein